jgi:hypothetical protein
MSDKYAVIDVLRELIADEKRRTVAAILGGLLDDKDYPLYVMRHKTLEDSLELIKQAIDIERNNQHTDEYEEIH